MSPSEPPLLHYIVPRLGWRHNCLANKCRLEERPNISERLVYGDVNISPPKRDVEERLFALSDELSVFQCAGRVKQKCNIKRAALSGSCLLAS